MYSYIYVNQDYFEAWLFSSILGFRMFATHLFPWKQYKEKPSDN